MKRQEAGHTSQVPALPQEVALLGTYLSQDVKIWPGELGCRRGVLGVLSVVRYRCLGLASPLAAGRSVPANPPKQLVEPRSPTDGQRMILNMHIEDSLSGWKSNGVAGCVRKACELPRGVFLPPPHQTRV